MLPIDYGSWTQPAVRNSCFVGEIAIPGSVAHEDRLDPDDLHRWLVESLPLDETRRREWKPHETDPT